MFDEDFVPDQVRRQAARAEELHRQLVGDDEADRQEARSTEPEGDVRAPTTAAEHPPEASPPPEPPQPAPPSEWEQRYRTLQGKYDSEIGAQRGQIAQMERLLATMQTPPAPPPAQQAAPQGPLQYNEADLELYGQDMLDAAARAADAKYANVIAQLQNKIHQLEGNQQAMTGANQQDRVFRELDADPELSGRWRTVNTNSDFLTWLQGVDEFSGLPRNTMLQHAYVSGDAMRTGRFFKKYMAEHTAPPPIATATQTVTLPAHNSGNGYVAAGGPRLEDLAAPGRAAGSTGNGAPQQRVWSRSEIKAFYRDRTSGKYRGREAEAQRLEEDLFRAEAEGRIA